MPNKLSYKRFLKLADKHARVAVYQAISNKNITPDSAYAALKGFAKAMTLLEKPGDTSHVCFNPIATVTAYGKQVTIHENKKTHTLTADPFEILRAYQSKLYAKTDHPLSGYLGGMVGFMSYDAIRLIEEIPDQHQSKNNIPDMLFRCYESNITFDHQTNKIIISSIADIKAADTPKTAYQAATHQINTINQQLERINTAIIQPPEPHDTAPINIDINDKQYCSMVETAKQHIRRGDIFQVVLSRNFSIKTKAQSFDIYRALKQTNPSPYMFYIEVEDSNNHYAIAGASPEKLISIKNSIIESRPLAGTAARNQTTTDNVIAKTLLNNKKEVAEHMMLVDLARNDIGAVAVPGSVEVTQLKTIEQYKRVMHISSTVQGVLRADLDVFDAIRTSFPAGTLSGAPKISAMHLIDKLENTRRGIYGGVICAIDNQSNLDSCIAIRTALIKNNIASVSAGAGIVLDSDPQAEADETYHKAKAILEGILVATGEIA